MVLGDFNLGQKPQVLKYTFGSFFYSFQSLGKFFDIFLYFSGHINRAYSKVCIMVIVLSRLLRKIYSYCLWFFIAFCLRSFAFCMLNILVIILVCKHFNFEIILDTQNNCKDSIEQSYVPVTRFLSKCQHRNKKQFIYQK